MADLVLDWALLGAYGTSIDGSATVETGGVSVDIGVNQEEGESAYTVSFNGDEYVGPGEPFDMNSGLKLFGDIGPVGPTDTLTTTFDFSSSDPLFTDQVQNVQFRINDIDSGLSVDEINAESPLIPSPVDETTFFQDIVEIRAFDAAGNPVTVNITPGANVDQSGNALTGDGSGLLTDASHSALVEIPGPVSRIEIDYNNGGEGAQRVALTDVHFSTVDVDGGDNVAPVAVDDLADTGESVAVTVDAAANDTDADGDTLTVTDVSDGTNGSAVVNDDGTVTYTPNDGFTGEDTISYTISDPSGETDTAEIVVSVTPVVVPCFTPGTLIATPIGERLVEDLRMGDRIITRDNGIQEIRWTGTKVLTGHNLARAPHMRPVLIQKGALGGGMPEHDILVSPNHRILVANDKTALYFEESEVLVAAKHLTGLDGVDEVGTMGVTYLHFMFDNHEVVLSNGAWTESFQPGDYTLEGIGNAQRDEIFDLFPELQSEAGINSYASARRSLKKHEARLLTK